MSKDSKESYDENDPLPTGEDLPVELGGYKDKRIEANDEMPLVPADTKMKVTPIQENFGQTMLDGRVGAKKPWKPKGR